MRRAPRVELVYFNADPAYLKRLLPEGSKRLISGRLEPYDGWLQMPHPDHVAAADRVGGVGRTSFARAHLPAHRRPHQHNLAQGDRRGASSAAGSAGVDRCELPRPECVAVLAEALAHIHRGGEADLLPPAPARARLAYDELLANQLALALIRARLKRRAGRRLAATGKLRKAVLAALPFTLTAAQKRALAEIDADLNSQHRMLRLLQGDVGSGKTLVALTAALMAIEGGYQVAIMAPTEILAEQHFLNIQTLIEQLGLRSCLLTSSSKKKQREVLLQDLQNGAIHIAIGTHALIQGGVEFRNLGLAIIDEQHKFGVLQRATLKKKGYHPDVLVMTATPIPRTLAMTLYGDLDVSIIDQLPPGRGVITTRVFAEKERYQVYRLLREEIGKGSRRTWCIP